MKNFTINISGKTQSDIEVTLDEVKRVIENGNTSGLGGGDDMSFSFESEGEYEEGEEDENV